MTRPVGMPLRILIVTPWPIRAPRNGGQLRARAVVRAYGDAGHEVRAVGVYDAGRTPPGEASPDDVPMTPEVVRIVKAGAEAGDDSVVSIWRAVAEAADCRERFAGLVRSFRPHVVQFEEPFLWPLVRRLRDDGVLGGATIVHSSYNFETDAWRDLRRAGATVSAATLQDIAALERELAAACDLTVTVSAQDAAAFRALGAARTCVAANGTDACGTDAVGRALGCYLPAAKPYALFVSSGHPPNARGFLELAARGRRPLRHGEIVVCGTVAGMLRSGPLALRARPLLDGGRLLGWVSTGMLAPLYARSRVVLLPKTLGGGSNLKTAEALASGRPIVATHAAFVGFEPFADLPGVSIVDGAEAFWEAVDARLADPHAGPVRRPESMAALRWSECLRPMVRDVEAVVGGRAERPHRKMDLEKAGESALLQAGRAPKSTPRREVVA